MTLRVVCDTNLLVSALIARGPPSRVLEEAIDGAIELLILAPVLAELEQVLTEKLGFTEAEWRDADTLLTRLASELPGRPTLVEAITGDPADDVILAAAVDAKADVLATGDKRHLLPVGEHRGVRILTAQSLLAELRRADP